MSLADAIRTGDTAELPSRRDEDWRWTDLRGLLRTMPPASPPGDAARLPAGPFAGLADDHIVFLNGRRIAGPEWLFVDPGQSRSVELRFISQAVDTAHAAAFFIDVAPGASLTLFESYEADGQGYVADVALEIRMAAGASLERVVVIDEAEDAVAIGLSEVELSANSRFAQTVLTSGAKRQRYETRVRHPGGHASVRLDGVYLIADRRQGDLTTQVVHGGPDGETLQLTKGAVRDQGRAVFQGRIVVSPGSDRTDAKMGHHALLLSGKAEVDAKPELEIYADDVSCAHGNTVGALDDQALFYAGQRGIPEPQARAMLTEAFVGQVVDRIEHEGARDVARAWVSERLRSGT